MSTVEPMPSAGAFAAPAKIGPWSITHRNVFFSIVPMDDGDASHFARTSQGLFWSNTGGIVWRNISQPPGIYNCLLAIGPDEKGPLYALVQSLYVSDSYGQRWTPLRIPGVGLSWWSMLAASRKTKGKLYLAGFYAPAKGIVLWSTSDGGQTWGEPRPVSQGETRGKSAPHPLLLDGDETVFMAAPDGVYRCGDEIVRVSRHAALDAMAVSTVSPQIATAGSLADGGGYHLQISKDRGATWSTKDPYPYRFEVNDLLFGEDLLFARVGRWDSASGGKFAESILMTNNAGDSWIDVTSPQLAAALAAGDGEGWPRKEFREGLSFGHGRLFLPNVLPSDLYSAKLSELRSLAPAT